MKNKHYEELRKVLEESKYVPLWKKRLLTYFDKYIVPIPYQEFLNYIDNPEKFVDYLAKKKRVKITPLKATYELVMHLVCNCSSISNVIRMKKWKEFYLVVNAMYNKYLEDRKAKKIDNLFKDGINYQYLADYRSQLNPADPLRILLDIYVLIPPARADYGSICLYSNEEELKNEPSPNYILFNDDKTGGKICLQQYKTAGIYDKIERDLPEEMLQDILKYLENKKERKYLFERDDKTAYNSKRFDEFANKQFRRIHKGLTINVIRKLYATYTGGSFKKMVKSAGEMKHHITTHVNNYVDLNHNALYNMITRDSDSESSDEDKLITSL